MCSVYPAEVTDITALIERRHESLDVSLERLLDVTSVGPPEWVAAQIMRHFVGNAVTRDDIALLVLRRTD